ncbi:septation ring formation regulator EzrA [Spiroplasma endosymbiont of Crioceris asparagi]|uniref:septation ring formation regulator EzrA n=1 Tax=Spiroplasma endosymbiont of Crioceris asparagi TaxID=3066286 RepID=UPI0030CB1192
MQLLMGEKFLNTSDKVIWLTLTIIVVFLVFGYLLFLFGYKYIIQTYAKTLDLINIIKKNQVKYKLKRIAEINKNTNTLFGELQIWRTNYEHYVELRLKEVYYSFYKFVTSKNWLIPTPKNIRKIKKINNEIKEIYEKLFHMLNEINNVLEVEDIQRDSITSYKEMFEKIKTETNMFIMAHNYVDEAKLFNTLSNIEQLFESFYNELALGKYENSVAILGSIKQALIFMIEMLDSIPRIVSTLKNTVPPRMEKLKKQYMSANSLKRNLSKNAKTFLQLEEKVNMLTNQINENLKNAQFKKAQKNLKIILKSIQSFNDEIVGEDKLKDYVIYNIDGIRKLIDSLFTSSLMIERAFRNVESLSKYPTKEKIEFDRAKAEFTKAKTKLDIIFSNWDVNRKNGLEIDIKDFKKRLLLNLEVIINEMDNFEKSAKKVKNSLTNKEKVNNAIVFIKAIILQSQSLIKQNKTISQLSAFEPKINEFIEELEKYIKDNQDKFENQQYRKDIEKDIEELHNRGWELFASIKDAIFYDFIAQEILVYLEKIAIQNPTVEKDLITLENMYRKKEMDLLMGNLLTILKQLRK